MRYAVLGNVAVLCTRGIENIPLGEPLSVSVSSVPDASSFCIHGAGGVRSYALRIGSDGAASAQIPAEELENGTFGVTVIVNEQGESGTVRRELDGSPFLVYTEADGRYAVIPAPASCATEHERLWSAVIACLEANSDV